MDDGDVRLMRCFASAFPSATPDEIRTAKFDAMPGWDSLRGVTLLAVLELETFDAVKRYLLQRGAI